MRKLVAIWTALWPVVGVLAPRPAVVERMLIVVLNDTWSFTLQGTTKIMEFDKTPAFDPIRDLPVFREFAETKVILPDAQSILIDRADATPPMDAP